MFNYLTEEQDNILKRASETWGTGFQKDMLQEECAELVTAVSHWKRDRVHISAIFEEVADVLIVCRQLMLDHANSGIEMYLHNMIESKMNRLEKRIILGDVNAPILLRDEE